MTQVGAFAKNLIDMVAALPAMELDKLYDSPFICQAILRSLPPLGKNYVMQTLFLESPVTATKSADQEWRLLQYLYSKKHDFAAVDRVLLQLRVFVKVEDEEEQEEETASYKMNPKFQSNIRNLIVHGCGTRQPMPSLRDGLPTVEVEEDLESYALEHWERFLLQLINVPDQPSSCFSPSLMTAFLRGGLLSSPAAAARFDPNESPKLTEKGFQFLLLSDTNTQIWYIIKEYIISASADRGVDPTELISFIIELSSGLPYYYNLNSLSGVQISVVKDLEDLGLVKLVLDKGKKEGGRFIPTKFAARLLVTSSSNKDEGYIIVETNFRLYAYSASKLHSEILSLFARIEYQLPNLIVGAITKESLYQAFRVGITAHQIISFLQQNAHPKVAEKIPALPENVKDQINLSERVRNKTVW